MTTTIPDSARLDKALRDAGCTFEGVGTYAPGVEVSPGGTLLDSPDGHTVRITPELPVGQVPAAQAVVDNFTFGATRPRLVYDIWADLQALSATQLQTTWNQFTAGSPPLWGAYFGGNSSAINALQWSATQSGAPVAAVNDARRRALAMYVQDHPDWLVRPPWDDSINVPGLEAVQ